MCSRCADLIPRAGAAPRRLPRAGTTSRGGQLQRFDQMNEQMQTRTTTVRGQLIVIYLFDGQRRFSDASEARQCEGRRQKILAERARSLKLSATFQYVRDP